MLTNVCETKLIEWQNHLYATYVHRENSLFYAVFVPVVDVLLETAKPVLKVLECAILVIVNLGGALAGHRRCWVKHAIVCAEEGVGSLAVFAVTWFSLPPVPGTQIISPIPVFRLLIQWMAVLRNRRTAQSVHGWNASGRQRRRDNEIEQPPVVPAPYGLFPLNDQPPPPPAGTSSAVVATTTPSSASTGAASSTSTTAIGSVGSLPSASVPASESTSAPAVGASSASTASTISAPAEGNNQTTVVITESAANKYREILAQENKTGWGLRFIPRAADSTGNRYYIEYSEKPKEGDKVFESQGIQIHIDSAHAQIFLGSILNYHSGDGPHSVGFHISKPKAISRFGIGYSPVIQPISIGASSSQTASAIPSLIIEPAASSATATTTASATGFQANTQPDSPVTPPETKPDEKRPDPVPSISQEMSVSPGTF